MTLGDQKSLWIQLGNTHIMAALAHMMYKAAEFVALGATLSRLLWWIRSTGATFSFLSRIPWIDPAPAATQNDPWEIHTAVEINGSCFFVTHQKVRNQSWNYCTSYKSSIKAPSSLLQNFLSVVDHIVRDEKGWLAFGCHRACAGNERNGTWTTHFGLYGNGPGSFGVHDYPETISRVRDALNTVASNYKCWSIFMPVWTGSLSE